jgi:DNA-binding NarL/FixJ family response regulator
VKKTIAIVDDHELIAKALSAVISQIEGYNVLFEVFSGIALIDKITNGFTPDIILLDINMPQMTGYEVAEWLQHNNPAIKVIALSMNDKEESIIQMVRRGACGYLIKGCSVSELKLALDSVSARGVYYSDFLTSKLIQGLNPKLSHDEKLIADLSIRELNFIKLACSELTYVEIADKLCVSPRTVDGYREAVFVKLNVKTRVGLVLAAIRLKIISI